jgi:hypothetical protein
MISHKHKFIFIHIPKNAGQSMEICLGGYEDKKKLWGVDKGVVLQHLKACELQEKIGDQIFNDYFKFSFVRNPFSKCVSEYFWDKKVTEDTFFNGNHSKFESSGKKLDFRDWVRLKLHGLIEKSENLIDATYHDLNQADEGCLRAVADRVVMKQKHNLEQYKFIYDTEGKCMVNFLGKFENLQEDFNIVCDKIGIPQQKLPHINKTKHKHYTEYYDEETREMVAEKYAKDTEYFGYAFGE